MKARRRYKFATAFLVALMMALAAPKVLAHAPFIDASIVCTDSGLTVQYTATSWAGDATGTNSQINILIDGEQVDSQPFELPALGFSGSSLLGEGYSAGDIVNVIAVAVGDWGDGLDGGQVNGTEVIVPETPCEPPSGVGRFTGGGSQIRVGPVRVTRGLTIHCDLLLSNNLQINWQGNHFHMLEHMETVACTDDPLIIQAPPAAPLDTLVGVGQGRYNGDEGYTVEFTLVDYGEPGRNDRMKILIYETANPGNVVLDVPLQVLRGGNLQAHYDQPHK